MVLIMTTPSYPSSSTNTSVNRTGPKPPGPVNGAFLVYLIAALVALIGIIVTVTSDFWDEAIRDNAGMVPTNGLSTEDAVNAAKIGAVVAGVIIVALYLLFAFKMRAGRNWARIVLTVLSALSIVSQFTFSASVEVNGRVYSSSLSDASGWVGTALAVVAIVLMFLPASNEYFARSKAAR